MVTRHGGSWYSGVGLLALALTGCSDSSTPPLSPYPPRPVVTYYTDPTHTLGTLAAGMVDKNHSNGDEAYLGGLADSSTVSSVDGRAFHAFFDARDLDGHPWPHDWTRELEPQLLHDLFAKYSSPFVMTWEPYEPAGNESGSADDSLLHRKYTIVQLVRNGSTTRREIIAVGAADLSFVRSAHKPGRWVIAQWQDYRALGPDSVGPTLGSRRLETQP